MNNKRIIELGFLALFAFGVGAALLVHQSFDEWLTQLVQASGRKVGVGRLELTDLRWLAAEQRLSLSSGKWFDADNTREPWLVIPTSQWQLAADAWQGPVLNYNQFVLQGVSVHIQQEGLSTNIKRLIKQVETVVIQPEKQVKGQEFLVYKINSCSLLNLHITLSTLKHGELTWDIPELVLPASVGEGGIAFDVLLQHFTLQLLKELQLQTTQHLIALNEADPAQSNPTHGAAE